MATVPLMETAAGATLLGKMVAVPRPTSSSSSLSLCNEKEEKLTDSAIDVAEELCGVLEHATVDDDSDDEASEDGAEEGSAVGDEKSDLFDSEHLLAASLLRSSSSRTSLRSASEAGPRKSLDTLRESYRSLASSLASSASSSTSSLPLDGGHVPRRAASAPPGPLPEAVLLGNMSVSGGGGDYSLWQPAFPQVFDVFDYGDGVCYYLGGGGHRITRHLSRRNRRGVGAGFDGLWPFANPPLYACRRNHASTGLPPVVLYGGPNADQDGAWADVQFGGAFGCGVTLGLPPLPSADVGPSSSSDGRAEEKLRVHVGWHNRYRFEVEVGSGASKARIREAFEWRYCSGAELAALDELAVYGNRIAEDDDGGDDLLPLSSSLCPPRLHTSFGTVSEKAGRFLRQTWTQGIVRRGGAAARGDNEKTPLTTRGRRTKKAPTRWQGGWQLVRLADASDPLAEAIKETSASTASTLLLDQLIGEEAGRAAERRRTSDGREIVATWANVEHAPQRERDEDKIGYGSLTASTIATARFTFLGSGKSGQLGERWALMAVASGLAIWERAQRQRRRRQSTVVQACGGLANIV